MSALGEGSQAVIDSEDQYEVCTGVFNCTDVLTMNQVFNDRNASDPSHSMLSKDHFGYVHTFLAPFSSINSAA